MWDNEWSNEIQVPLVHILVLSCPDLLLTVSMNRGSVSVGRAEPGAALAVVRPPALLTQTTRIWQLGVQGRLRSPKNREIITGNASEKTVQIIHIRLSSELIFTCQDRHCLTAPTLRR